MSKSAVVYLIKSLFSLSLYIFPYLLIAQENIEKPGNQEIYQLPIRPTNAPIELDGELEEDAWKAAEAAKDFWMKYPQDDKKAERQTEVRITYDDKFLYIGAICYDTSYYVVQTLKRDSRYFDSDGFAVVIDPVAEQTNGFFFGVSPMNVQTEDLITPSAFGDLNFSWDNKWFSEVKRYKDRWTVEIAIPYKTLRFEAGKTEWGINFIRNDLKKNQYHTWTNVPINFNLYDLGYTGRIHWETPPNRTGTNVALIPYVTGSLGKDNELDASKTKAQGDVGLDAKVAVTSSLNLDLTVNPDFSQIEVDRQQTNLTRFDLFFPERRTFFLENADLFSEFGTPPARPFFSRRIGLDQRGLPIPILFGARLSGNLNKDLRVGLMNMQTGSTDIFSAQNYSTFAFHQRVLDRSLVKGYATNRQGFSGNNMDSDEYGRNAGLELNYLNQKGTWNVFAGYHLSSTPGFNNNNYFRNLGARYSGRNFSAFIDYIGMGTNYHADMGFIRRIENYDAVRDTTIRLGYEHLHTSMDYTIRPKEGSIINAHEFGFQNTMAFNPDGTLNDRSTGLGYEIEFQNTSELGFEIEDQDVRLLFPISFTDAEPLPAENYRFLQYSSYYESDARKPFAFLVEFQRGEFYNGDLQRYNFELTYRRQPWGNFTLGFEQNDVRFPEPFGKRNLSLISQRTEINFSNSIFWTTFLQYNTQLNNFNINSRLQWRYRPMSDLFLVFTDNYFTDPLMKNKNRTFVFKLNYWLNL